MLVAGSVFRAVFNCIGLAGTQLQRKNRSCCHGEQETQNLVSLVARLIGVDVRDMVMRLRLVTLALAGVHE